MSNFAEHCSEHFNTSTARCGVAGKLNCRRRMGREDAAQIFSTGHSHGVLHLHRDFGFCSSTAAAARAGDSEFAPSPRIPLFHLKPEANMDRLTAATSHDAVLQRGTQSPISNLHCLLLLLHFPRLLSLHTSLLHPSFLKHFHGNPPSYTPPPATTKSSLSTTTIPGR